MENYSGATRSNYGLSTDGGYIYIWGGGQTRNPQGENWGKTPKTGRE